MATQNLGRVGLVLKGEWDSATAYTALDVVSHDGNAWAAKQNSTNVEPTTGNSDFWQLFSNNADLVATVQGLKESAESSAAAAAVSAQKAEEESELGANAMQGIAPVFAPTEAYAAGDYVWYRGILYRFTETHSAGEWTGTDAAAAVIGNDLTDLKSAVGAMTTATASDEGKALVAKTVSGGKVTEWGFGDVGGESVPLSVRHAIYSLFNAAGYSVVDVSSDLAIVQGWAAGIALSETAINISENGTYQLTATVYPAGSIVTWSTSDSSVATVSDGLVSAVSVGSAVITATSGDYSASCAVTVAENVITFQSGYTRSHSTGKLEAANDRSVSSIIYIDGSSAHTISCKVNNASVNIVLRIYDANGLIAVSNGFASSQTTPTNSAITAFSVVLQTELTNEAVVLTIDGADYNAVIGTVEEYNNTVSVNVSISGIDTTTGEPTTNSARLLTDYIPFINKIGGQSVFNRVSFTAKSGYYIKVFEYAGSTFLSSKTIGGMNSNIVSGNVDSTCTQIRILFKKSDGSDFTSADIQNLTLNNHGLVDYVFTEV